MSRVNRLEYLLQSTSSVWFLLNIANMVVSQIFSLSHICMSNKDQTHGICCIDSAAVVLSAESADNQAKGHNLWRTLALACPGAMCLAI